MTTQRWDIDSGHSGIHFSVRHMVVAKVRGKFTRWSADVELQGDDLTTASVQARIDTSSIDTGVEDRDTHLKSADFFDVGSYPEMTFKTRSIARLSDDQLRMVGDLTIRDVTREVVLDVDYLGETKDPWGNTRVGLAAKGKLDRKDFGLTWNQLLEAGGVMVGDRIDIEIELEAVKQSAAKAA